ncbi:MAG TPA: phosphoenolpyruvate--protein phosphotransferase [Burkholderiales bacterium]|jgi:phosphotransferase system enzyme I (PtsI)|nr:phosphoenolpyruvate--protein phosphotransferase [Burkholderiales bacterium]
MSFTLHGIPVSGGIAIGRAHLITPVSLDVSHYLVELERVKDELARYTAAVHAVQAELRTLHDSLSAAAPGDLGTFIDLHSMILADPMLAREPLRIIEERRCNAEWALIQQMDTLVAQFEDIEDAYLRERKNDITQVVERVLKALTGAKSPIESALAKARSQEGEMLVVAHDLSPADMLLFKEHQFAGFVTDVGGPTSHTAILARSLALPAIVALHHAREMIEEDDWLILDGSSGVLIVAPDTAVLEEYRWKRGSMALEKKKLERLRYASATTLDGSEIELHANIELPEDAIVAREAGATGIGLFRTEFLFMNRKELPSEDEQFESYRKVVQAMDGMPVTIRTLDIGADKEAESMAREQTALNPALGLRAIRYCLAEPQIFLAQLRAILRASHYGKVKILLPMIAHAHEVAQAKYFIGLAKEQLDLEGTPYAAAVEVGGMIEIPAAALSLGLFVKKLDYLSIGTNDLIQYTLAIDRADDEVAYLYDPLHPAVLGLISHTIRGGAKAHVPVAVCGEMAGELRMTRLLLGMGLKQFSMHPANLLAVKQRIVGTNLAESGEQVKRILRAEEPDRLRDLVDALNA